MPRPSRSGVPFSSAKITKASGSESGTKAQPERSKPAKKAQDGRSRLLAAATDDVAAKRTSGKNKRIPRDKLDEQALGGMNVYDFVAAPVKNARTSSSRFQLSREEAVLAGNKRRSGVDMNDDSSDEASDGEDDMARRIRKAALTIAGEAPLQLDDDDDEELDSDGAFNSGDEERWGGNFGSRKSSSRKDGSSKGRSGSSLEPELELDLDETSDEDMKRSDVAVSETDEAEVDESEDDELEPALPSDSEMEDDDEEIATEAARNELENFVATLPSAASKRKAIGIDANLTMVVEDEAADMPAKRRRVLASQQGPGGREDAGEFGVGAASKLTLSSLIESDPSLRSTIEGLLPKTEVREASSTLKSGTLSAPLPTVVLDRLAREAAYEQTSQEGAKWGAVMKRIKEADQLKFPLQLGGTASQGSSKDRQRGGVKSGGDLMGDFQATNELESAVTALLMSANLKDSQIQQAEKDALEGQDITAEEVSTRRAELRRQRELLFREETRLKRISKIKSKTYRKLARKRADKAGGEIDLDQLRELDPERAEEEQAKLETARARERATLKHSAKGGRWAQNQHGAGEIEGKRQEMENMLAQGERLRRKVQGHASDGSESESDGDNDEGTDVQQRAFDELANLQSKQVELDQEVANHKPNSIFAMKFMQDAALRERKEVDAQEEELRRQLEGYDDIGINSGSESDDSAAENVARVGGRFILSGTGAVDSSTGQHPMAGRSSGETGQESRADQNRVDPALKQPSAESSEASNPWANLAQDGSGQMRKKNTVVSGKGVSAADRAIEALKKRQGNKTGIAKQRIGDDAVVEIQVDGSTSSHRKTKPKSRMPLKDDSDHEDQDEESGANRGPRAFDQRDLVAQAFAGDNVVEEFAAEKQKAIERDAPKEQDITLPGWGSWGGKGVKKNKNAKKFTKKIAGVDEKARKDAGKSNVIISEKKAKAEKYLSTSLPYPYTSQSQYEQALSSNTIAPETSTMGSFQRGITPRIIKKPGAILQPLKKLHSA